MDLTIYEKAFAEGALMMLKDPAEKAVLLQDDGKTPVTIRLAGTRSSRWVKAADAVGNKINSMKEARTVEEAREDRASLLASVTLEWDGVKADGVDLECTPANAKALYLRFTWVSEQVDRFLGKQENFLPASSGS